MAQLPAAKQVAEIDANLARHAKQARGAYSKNTERAYKADTAIYQAWCANHDRPYLPTDAETVAAFVDAMAETRKPATVRRYVSSIAKLHTAAKVDDPTKAETVALALKRMHRSKGRRQDQARGLTEREFRKCLDILSDTAIDQRDKAILCIGRCMLARSSELVSLLIDDMELAPDGSATILLRQSKADQEAEGHMVYLPRFAAQAAQKWIWTSGKTSGPIIRSVNRHGAVNGSMNPQSIGPVIRKIAKRAGIDPKGLSSHSLRVGMCQDLTSSNMELPAIQQAGRWKSPTMPGRYAERISAGKGAVAKFYAE